jgi:hypothetical protein
MSSATVTPQSPAIVRNINIRPTHKARWTGGVLSAVPVLFMVFDSVIKFTEIQPVTESFTRLGYNVDVAPVIGLLELICLSAYLLPRTAVLGAVLLTGFLGGAIATHVRVADPLFSHILFPTYIAALLWSGLYLRDPRVRELVRRTLND